MLIGLHGKARSGKDTTYGFIAEWANAQGRPARRDAFADRLKLSAARIFRPTISLAEAVAWCDDLKEGRDDMWGVGVIAEGPVVSWDVSGRTFLQRYGTEAHREVFGTDFWVSAVLDGYDPDELLVVTDARFPNEAEAIRSHGGEVWHIIRGEAVISENDHASEKPLPVALIDRVIRNSQDLPHLASLVHSHMDSLVTLCPG